MTALSIPQVVGIVALVAAVVAGLAGLGYAAWVNRNGPTR